MSKTELAPVPKRRSYPRNTITILGYVEGSFELVDSGDEASPRLGALITVALVCSPIGRVK